ncbi:hypothetical protein DPMN_065997 [Dreissena polymorpha]|uniref:Uncharacterized protein n=1 Tax=Dreissena polymorpha TaxID=45954 RepID=A0A9D4BSH7_DREPO|nr:hypothetical protein DPMN_065997 [Dreissena polymorpha]
MQYCSVNWSLLLCFEYVASRTCPLSAQPQGILKLLHIQACGPKDVTEYDGRSLSVYSQNSALLWVEGHSPKLLPVPQTTEVRLKQLTLKLR